MSVEVEDEAFDPDNIIGVTLANRYQIEKRLGEGAMGTVYRAKHVKVGRAFAVTPHLLRACPMIVRRADPVVQFPLLPFQLLEIAGQRFELALLLVAELALRNR